MDLAVGDNVNGERYISISKNNKMLVVNETNSS